MALFMTNFVKPSKIVMFAFRCTYRRQLST